ncbi:hypothetical protein ACIBED_19010 [Rhodococcus coprophilus]|uniref:Uncharacterized protein n=1 Tax=Rhodococcus coprophilus TaxID=38310 RepID=A0A2X4TLS4_9NOCA|nr:hypothetical protein [Rhodococcus coprophilus]MBM7460547.1 hypothetical protein [Rhodococcus coprophilus]SQI28356.1 Uncharacterised protein [Rhodococcus coprophilus]
MAQSGEVPLPVEGSDPATAAERWVETGKRGRSGNVSDSMQLRRDPLMGSWAGLPISTRAPMIEIGVETAVAVVAEERPDLVYPIWYVRPRTFRARVWLRSCAGV